MAETTATLRATSEIRAFLRTNQTPSHFIPHPPGRAPLGSR
jgi:hypothetical protein